MDKKQQNNMLTWNGWNVEKEDPAQKNSHLPFTGWHISPLQVGTFESMILGDFPTFWSESLVRDFPPSGLHSLKLTFSPLKMVVSNRNLPFPGSIFQGLKMLVSGRVIG